MIENERQYRVMQEQMARLEAGLARLATPEARERGIDPALLEAERGGVRSLLATLYDEIAVYEAKHGRPATDEHGNRSAAELETRRADSRSRGGDTAAGAGW